MATRGREEEFCTQSKMVRIQTTIPGWSPAGYICLTPMNRFRAEYVQSVIEEDRGQLPTLEEQAVESLKEAVYLSLWKLDEKTAVTCPHCQSDKVKKLVTGFFAKTTRNRSFRFLPDLWIVCSQNDRVKYGKKPKNKPLRINRLQEFPGLLFVVY